VKALYFADRACVLSDNEPRARLAMGRVNWERRLPLNVFLRLMHEGISTAGPEDRTIDTTKEFVRGRRPVFQIRERLRSAFPVLSDHLLAMSVRSRRAPTLRSISWRAFTPSLETIADLRGASIKPLSAAT
jgi:hypothetical protein